MKRSNPQNNPLDCALRVLAAVLAAVSLALLPAGASLAGDDPVPPYREGRRIEFLRVLGMVFDERTGEPVADCPVAVGERLVRTGEDGLFELRNCLSGDYVVSVDFPPFQKYADVFTFRPPLAVVRITLSVPVAVDRDALARAEYDELLAGVMRMNTFEVTIGDEEDGPARKPKKPYFSPFGRSAASGEKGRSGVAPGEREESKQPKISTARGFSRLVGRVVSSSGEPLSSPARVVIGPKVVLTDRKGNFELQNVPVGKYDITIKCKGYQTRTYDRVAVDGAHSKYDFYIAKTSK